MSDQDAPLGDDDLTPGERAYIESGGNDIDLLEQEARAQTEKETDDGEKAPAKTEADKTAPVLKDGQPPPEGDDEEDEIEIGDDGKPKNPGQYVRHGALHKERERRKAITREFEEYRSKNDQRFARVDERLKILMGGGQKPGEQEKPKGPPDPEADIFEAVRWTQEQLLKQGETSASERESSQIVNAYRADAAAFLTKEPAFGAAYKHLVEGRARELAALGHDEATIQRSLHQEEMRLAAQALREGKSPAQVLYNVAVARGFQKPDPAAGGEGQGGGQGQGADKGAAARAAAERLETVRKAKDASLSLSAGSGGGSVDLDATALADMDEADFDKMLEKMSPAKRREIFGN